MKQSISMTWHFQTRQWCTKYLTLSPLHEGLV